VSAPTFDAYADDDAYDRALADSLSVSGETKAYFAAGRVRWVQRYLQARGHQARHVLDYGCGLGDTAPLLHDALSAPGAPCRVTGVDVSPRTIAAAKERHAGRQFIDFGSVEAGMAAGAFDVGYCNGVFHHIAPVDRGQAVDGLYRATAPGGRFFLFENSPLNPGTHLIMSRCAFDDEAVLLPPWRAAQLLAGRGFVVEAVRFLFVFPRPLSALRFLERRLERVPLGAQYVVVGKAPDRLA
jgi:SAM-dependent methyltransferase